MSDAMQELLNSAMQTGLDNVYTAMPCVVINVRNNLDEQMVDIQPAISQKMKDMTVAERPPILGVPVQFPASSSSALTFPIRKGDTGLAIFSMRSIEAWKSGNGFPAAPANFAKFDKSDAVFIPGVFPQALAINNPNKRILPHSTRDTVIAHNIGTALEVEVRLGEDGRVAIHSPTSVEVTCKDAVVYADTSASITTPLLTVDATQTNWFGNINLTGNLIQNGSYTSTGLMTFNGINFATHVHGNSPLPSN